MKMVEIISPWKTNTCLPTVELALAIRFGAFTSTTDATMTASAPKPIYRALVPSSINDALEGRFATLTHQAAIAIGKIHGINPVIGWL